MKAFKHCPIIYSNMYKEIVEGKAKVKVPVEKKVSKKLPVFYNPDMEFNRSVSVALLNSIGLKDLRMALPLAGSGVRGIRFLKELKKGIVESVDFNDYNPEALKLIENNILLNNIKDKFSLFSKDANLFLLESSGYDYIDIDPFGSPNFLLNSSAIRISRGGILAVTATDTGALAGSFMNAGRRKYWAKPMKNSMMHEIALRILIRKCQLMAGQFEKALIPIYGHATLHYDRVYFRVEKGRQKVDALFREHKYFLYCPKCLERQVSEFNNMQCSCGGAFDYAGPLWVGPIWDSKLAGKIKLNRITDEIAAESKIETVGFYDIHDIGRVYKIEIPKMDVLLSKIKGTRTHFSPYGIRTKLKLKEIIEKIKNI